MKLIKSLFIISISMLACYSANANTQKSKATAQEQSQTEKSLKQFSETISLRFGGVEINKVNNQSIVNFNYVVENKSKKKITQIHWETVYFYQDKAILVQDVPAPIKDGLKAKQSLPLVFSIPFDNLPEQAKTALSTQGAQISAQFRAKTITFSDGSKIEVK
ncbi:hypothetical protein ACWIYZ_08735 [Ursidibacter arcticus]